MKGLILAAGRGSRLPEITASTNKCITTYNGIPLIHHTLRNLAEAGIEEAVIVVGYRAQDVMEKVGTSIYDVKINYVLQHNLSGVVDAIALAQESMNSDDFILCLGDEFMDKPRHIDMINQFKKNKKIGCLIGYTNVSDETLISKTYSIQLNSKKEVIKLVEKPRIFPNKMMGTGNICFRNKIFEKINKVKINKIRNQKELPDLIMATAELKQSISIFEVCEKYYNLNNYEDYLQLIG